MVYHHIHGSEEELQSITTMNLECVQQVGPLIYDRCPNLYSGVIMEKITGVPVRIKFCWACLSMQRVPAF